MYMSYGVDQIYLINMDKDMDRLSMATKEFKKHNISFKRFSGVDGKSLDAGTQKQYISPVCGMFCPYGVQGCAMSHIKVWEDVVKHGYAHVIVFEDDVVLDDDFNAKLKDHLEELPRNYDILYLGCLGIGSMETNLTTIQRLIANLFYGHKVKRSKSPYNKIKIPICPYGTHAYMLSNAGCRKLLKYVKRKRVTTHIDAMILDNLKNMNHYICSEQLAKQNFTVPSTIQDREFPRLMSGIFHHISYANGMPLSQSLGINMFRIKYWTFNRYYVYFFILGGLSRWFPRMLYLFLASIFLDVFALDGKTVQAGMVFLIGRCISNYYA